MATSAETAERIEQLQGMILEGQPNTVCLTFARQTWGGLQSAGVSVAQESLGSDKGRHRGIWNRPSGAAELVNPDAYGRGWSSDEAKQSWSCSWRHPSARSHDGHRLQQPPFWRRTRLRAQKLQLVQGPSAQARHHLSDSQASPNYQCQKSNSKLSWRRSKLTPAFRKSSMELQMQMLFWRLPKKQGLQLLQKIFNRHRKNCQTRSLKPRWVVLKTRSRAVGAGGMAITLGCNAILFNCCICL